MKLHSDWKCYISSMCFSIHSKFCISSSELLHEQIILNIDLFLQKSFFLFMLISVFPRVAKRMTWILDN